MNTLVYVKKGDLEPPVEATLRKADGTAIDLTNAASIKFLMQPSLDAAAAIVDAETGQVKYDWVVGDTNTAGHFLAEFEITWTGGRTQTVPNRAYIHVYITEDIA